MGKWRPPIPSSKDTYLNPFLVGSSAPVILPFFYGAAQIPERKYELAPYMLRVPLYFGFANIFRILAKNALGLTSEQSFLIMSQLSPAVVSAWITYRGSYDFPTKERWYQQYALLWLAHGFTWLVTIPQLEKLAGGA